MKKEWYPIEAFVFAFCSIMSGCVTNFQDEHAPEDSNFEVDTDSHKSLITTDIEGELTLEVEQQELVAEMLVEDTIEEVDTPMVFRIPPQILLGHDFQNIYKFGEEYGFYAAFSYVLIPSDSSHGKSLEKYRVLVDEITGFSSAAIDEIKLLGEQNSEAENKNLFILPMLNGQWDDQGYPVPNYRISKSILSSVRVNSELGLFGTGPYVITTTRPIAEINQVGEVNLLYLNLSNVHIDAIPSAVEVYRQTLYEDGVDGVVKLRSLRVGFYNYALHFEEHINFAKIAYSRVLGFFENQ